MRIPLILALLLVSCSLSPGSSRGEIEQLVRLHARAWETGDAALLDAILHEEVVFAYPRQRLNKSETIADLLAFNASFADTRVYLHRIIIDGNDLAVEWQFATTNRNTSTRSVVSDAIIGKIRDGKIIVWKEYLDGRVKQLQAAGELALEEGEEPFPWPKPKIN